MANFSKSRIKSVKKYLILKNKFNKKQTNTNIKTNTIWVRLLYTHPSSLILKLLKQFSKFDNFCKYYDVPIQHASSEILKKNGEKLYYSRSLFFIYNNKKNRFKCSFKNNSLTGFPGETDKDFQILLKFIKDIKFNHLAYLHILIPTILNLIF